MTEAHDLSFMGLFLQADVIVKSVMVLLAASSVVCWAIIFEKIVRLGGVKRQVSQFERANRNGENLQKIKGDLPQSVIAAGFEAWHDRDPEESRSERRERIERAMKAALVARLRKMERGLPFLATIGSSAPFIGLFGTVWGIMNSFSAIAQSQDTSLAVVAPGIAEALFATAIGLVAAIPSVMAYNKFSTDLARIGQRTSAIIGDLGNRLARDSGHLHARTAAAE
jgi:biopolymer transport protein TolQ